MQQQKIQQILTQHFPHLSGQQLTIHLLSSTTNLTYAVRVNQIFTLIFKLFTPGNDHQLEQKIAELRHQEGIGSKSLVFGQQYSIQEFIGQSQHPLPHQLISLPLFQAIMIKLHKLHELNIPCTQSQEKIPLARKLFSQNQLQSLLKLKGHHPQNPNYLKLLDLILDVLCKGEEQCKLLLPQTNQSLRVCHNDLNNLNLLVRGKEVFLIDYDYAAYNFLAYDIANIINQACFDYSLMEYPGFQFMKSCSPETIYALAQSYPGSYPQLKNEVLKFMCVVNLFWAIWSLQKFGVLTSQIFGSLEHGLKRMELFHHYKELVLAQAKNKS